MMKRSKVMLNVLIALWVLTLLSVYASSFSLFRPAFLVNWFKSTKHHNLTYFCRYNTTMVAAAFDGTLHFIDTSPYEILWSFPMHHSIYSSSRISYIDDYMDVGDDWLFHRHGRNGEISEFPISASDFLSSSDKNEVVSSNSVLRIVIELNDEVGSTLTIKRQDFMFSNYSKDLKPLWSVSVAEFDIECFSSSMGSRKVPVLRYKREAEFEAVKQMWRTLSQRVFKWCYDCLISFSSVTFALGVVFAFAMLCKEGHRTLLSSCNYCIGKMKVSCHEIGQGSDGTIVFEGSFDGREAAIKRVLKKKSTLGVKREINALKSLDYHPNIVTLFDVEQDYNFFYIAVERCLCSFWDVILHLTGQLAHIPDIIANDPNFVFWDASGLPSVLLMQLLLDIVKGIMHLHVHNFLHRDIKPQNILLSKKKGLGYVAKISDFGITKDMSPCANLITHTEGVGTVGWQAPEMLISNCPQSFATDMFSFGLFVFFALSRGHHAFGEESVRVQNLKVDAKDLSLVQGIPEAVHLLESLLQASPSKRPTATAVVNHPFFWNSERRMDFLIEVSDHIKRNKNNTAMVGDVDGLFLTALGGVSWTSQLDRQFMKNVTIGKAYDGLKVHQLLRLIRNCGVHVKDMTTYNISYLGGRSRQDVDLFYRQKFPKLLILVHEVMRNYAVNNSLGQYY